MMKNIMIAIQLFYHKFNLKINFSTGLDVCSMLFKFQHLNIKSKRHQKVKFIKKSYNSL